MNGSVSFRNGRWQIDADRNLGSLIANQMNCDALVTFLDRNYSGAGRLLDLGAGSRPYAPLYERYFCASVGVDVPRSPHVNGDVVFAEAEALPFEDQYFDCVICTEMLEHSAEPQKVMEQISRVLKPGGRAFLTTPFYQHLHEAPYDFYRYTSWALKHLAEEANLEVEAIKPRGGYGAVLMRLLHFPLVKAAKKVHFQRYNPLLWLFVKIPQQAYLARWRKERPTEFPLGYITELRKP
jgi:SAM-dependent methyltransferase